MYLQLDEHDRIVVEYRGPVVDQCRVCGHEGEFFMHGDEAGLRQQGYRGEELEDIKGGLHAFDPRPANRVIVACGEEVLDTETYMLLWQLRTTEAGADANKWQVIWRGNWKTTMDQFSDLVGDVDADALVENQNLHRERMSASAEQMLKSQS